MSLPERPKRTYGFSRICSIPDCGGKHSGLGFCKEHYGALRRQGDPLASPKRARTPAEALALRTVREGDCLIWTGSKNGRGYGKIRSNGKTLRAHRFAWEQARGPIPDGAEIDHICWRRDCCNVDHMRISSRAENLRNRSGAARHNKSTGRRNVYPNASGFQVRIRVDGPTQNFGTFPTVEEAAKVAEARRAELFGQFSGRG